MSILTTIFFSFLVLLEWMASWTRMIFVDDITMLDKSSLIIGDDLAEGCFNVVS
jgi:hypothetical protein